MLREYEFTLITRGDLADADHAKVLEKYEEIFKREDGQIIDRDDWGVKKLAHAIKKQYRGRYVFYDMAAAPASLDEAERLMRIDDQVLRFMSVKLGNEVDIPKRKIEIQKFREAAREQEAKRETRR